MGKVETPDDADNVTRGNSDCADSFLNGQICGEDIVRARDVARTITFTLDFDQAYEEFAGEVWGLVHFDRLAVHLLDPEAGADAIKYVSGQTMPGIQIGDRRPVEGTETQHVMRTRPVLVRPDMAIGPRFSRDPQYLELGLRSSIVVRLETRGQLVGALNLSSRQPGAYREREQALLEYLGREIAPAVANAQRYERTREEGEQAVAALEELRVGHYRLETQPKLAKEELGKFSHALACCSDAVMFSDREAIIQYVNPDSHGSPGTALEKCWGNRWRH